MSVYHIADKKSVLTAAIIYLAVFIAISLYLVPVLLFRGSYFPMGEPDHFFIWEIVYRMALGQIPHQDFFSPPGFYPSLLPAIVYKIASLTTPIAIDRAFLIGQCFNAIAATLVAVWFTRGTLSVWGRLLVIFSIATLIGSPAELGAELFPKFIFWDIRNGVSYRGIYDVVAAGLLALVLFRLAYKPVLVKHSPDKVDGLLTGFLIVALFFSKVTYFLFGLVFFAPLAYYLFPENRRMMHWAIASAITLLIVLEVAYKHVVSGYFLDLLTLKQTYHVSLGLKHAVIRHLKGLSIVIVMLSIIGITAYYYKTDSLRRLYFYLLPWPIAYIFINNYDTFESIAPFLSSLGLYIMALGQYKQQSYQKQMTLYTVLKYATILILSLPVLSRISVHFSSVMQLAHITAEGKILSVSQIMKESDPIGLIPQADTAKKKTINCFCKKQNQHTCWQELLRDGPTISYRQYLQDGFQLIRQVEEEQGEPIDNLLSFDFSNPFTLLRKKTPPKAIPVWFNGVTLSSRCRPSINGLFSHVDYVLVPEFPFLADTVLDFKRWYGKALQNRYKLIGETDTFKLYKKRNINIQKTKRYVCIPHAYKRERHCIE